MTFSNLSPLKVSLDLATAVCSLSDYDCLGARVYYLRSILHDWPDSKSRVILSHLAAAMTKDHSKILINELVVSNRGAGLHPTQLDLSMMVCLAGMERSEGQWQELARSVGLKIESIWTADPNTESILELVLA